MVGWDFSPGKNDPGGLFFLRDGMLYTIHIQMEMANPSQSVRHGHQAKNWGLHFRTEVSHNEIFMVVNWYDMSLVYCITFIMPIKCQFLLLRVCILFYFQQAWLLKYMPSYREVSKENIWIFLISWYRWL